ncbi:M48 family metallopeptidase [Francisella frigiditurris]|uniref:YgjP-like metallopeptidase domain-containing protein n=1 Tax=Francisella frigiditurris TaxID=1542390 RepID=A0A1J0KUI9_9GAMM|nr:SprT family zinc-dependent metalloprotease [Francisella frigiditurris]APC97409.1 hypothetical protein KX01_1802 [Francisella frigiditurris]
MFDNIEITYKRVKNLKISVKASGVNVIAPIGISQTKILDILKEKAKWIEKQQNRISLNNKFDYSQITFSNMDEVYFLGERYSVQIIDSVNNLILEKGDVLEFYLNSSVINNIKFKQKLFHEFIFDRADIILNNLVAKYLKITGQEIERVSIKKMRTRWGSCNHVKRTINLNVDLILRNIKSVEYVVLHEIAHLTHPNHSKEFYKYIEQYMPDWKARERAIK